MKKILIAGACGYIGARLSKYLAERGFLVTAFDSFEPLTQHPWYGLMDEFIKGDIREEKVLKNLSTRQFDAAINLISLDHNQSEQNPPFVASINVLPTWNLLENMIPSGLDLFIYFSTQQVLGKLPNETIDESFLPNPSNKYGLTHLLSEQIVNYYNKISDTKCINVRLSNGYGSPVFEENNCWWLVINDLCKTAFNKHKIVLTSNGSPQRDFIHISDICKAIEVLLNGDDKFVKNTFHLTSGKTLTILELAHEVKKVYTKIFKKEVPIYLPDNTISESLKEMPLDGKFHLVNNRMKNIGFQPEMNLENGIIEIFDYLESYNA